MRKPAYFAAPLLALCVLLAACAAPKKAAVGTCTIVAECRDVLDRLDTLEEKTREVIPADGLLLPPCEVEFTEGATVWDAFVTAAQSAKLQYESDGAGESPYLVGIGNLYTGDAGDASGWVFEVNGTPPDTGCGQLALQDGDEIAFRYVCDFNEYFAQ